MSLQDTLDAFRANFEAGGPPWNAPAWIHEPMHRATAELIASGAARQALKAGDTAPAFTLNDPEGKPVSLAELLAQGPIIVTFYRTVYCAHCCFFKSRVASELSVRCATLSAARNSSC